MPVDEQHLISSDHHMHLNDLLYTAFYYKIISREYSVEHYLLHVKMNFQHENNNKMDLSCLFFLSDFRVVSLC